MASLAVNKVIASELWGVSPHDPATFVVVSAVVVAAGVAGVLVPSEAGDTGRSAGGVAIRVRPRWTLPLVLMKLVPALTTAAFFSRPITDLSDIRRPSVAANAGDRMVVQPRHSAAAPIQSRP